MSLRIRKDGTILCAALHPEMEGDTYIDDALHYEMSVIHAVIVTEPEPLHSKHGQWWWSGNIPDNINIEHR